MTNTSLAQPARPEPPTRESCRADRALALYVEHAEEIALSFRAGAYRVPSCSGAATYTVRLVPEVYCSCPDGRGGECKHAIAVRIVRKTTAPCASCGRRFRHRELTEVTEDHGSLTWFEGDLLCDTCLDAHGDLLMAPPNPATTGDERVAGWMRRFTDRMSWEGRMILADVRRAERLDGAGSVKLGDVLERCAAIPEEEGRNVVRAWQLRTHALILSRSPIAEDDAELDRFVELGVDERLIAESVLGIHEADTVDGALRSWAERAAACEEAETRRAGFRAL